MRATASFNVESCYFKSSSLEVSGLSDSENSDEGQLHLLPQSSFPDHQIACHSGDAVQLASNRSTPSFRELLTFQSTITLIWLVEPLLSLIDTMVVGWTAPNATIQLAAMGPATTLMDTLLYMTYFLATGSTNQLAPLISEIKATTSPKRKGELYRRLRTTTNRFMGLAVSSGVGVLLTIWLLGTRLLSLFSENQDIIELAKRYCIIRAFLAPVAVLNMVTQSVCLVNHQTGTVRSALGAAVVGNCICDAVLTPWMGMNGAALAKVFANGSESVILIRSVCRSLRTWRHKEQVWEEFHRGSMLSGGREEEASSQPANTESLWRVIQLSLPLALASWARMGAYCALTMRATNLGILSSAAAHNIILRVYYLMGCVADSMGQTTQNFLPTTLYPKFHVSQYASLLQKLALLCLAAAIVGASCAYLLLSSLGGVFVEDKDVKRAISSAAPTVTSCLGLHSFSTFVEGIMIAKRDFRNLALTYMAATTGFLMILPHCEQLKSIWLSLVCWQVLRMMNFLLGSEERQSFCYVEFSL